MAGSDLKERTMPNENASADPNKDKFTAADKARMGELQEKPIKTPEEEKELKKLQQKAAVWGT